MAWRRSWVVMPLHIAINPFRSFAMFTECNRISKNRQSRKTQARRSRQTEIRRGRARHRLLHCERLEDRSLLAGLIEAAIAPFQPAPAPLQSAQRGLIAAPDVSLGSFESTTSNAVIGKVQTVDLAFSSLGTNQPTPFGSAVSPVSAVTAPAWAALGPAPLPNGQTKGRSDPVSGRVTAIAIHPTNPSLIYVGTAQGGVYRSLNGGTNWTPIFDAARSLAIGALALAPSNPSILYVGTGEANGSADSYAGVGLYRVDNADTIATLVGPINPVRNYTDGSSNPQSTPVFNGRSIAKIVVHPTQPGTVFVGTAGGVIGIGGNAPFGGTIPPLGLRGLYRSTNANGPLASITFDRIKVSTSGGGFDLPNTGNRNINDIVMDPSDPTGNTLIVWQNGTSAAGDGGVYRSTSALAADPTTVSFSQTFATTASSSSDGRAVFAFYNDGVNPTVIYEASGEPSSGTSCTSSSQSGAVRRSIDGGVTWSAKLVGGGGFAGGQAFYDIGLAVVPGATTATSDDVIHLGGNVSSASCQRLHGLSTDGGATFSNQDTGLHPDTHVIAVAPSDPMTVYHGNDGGLWKSVDGGLTWTSLNKAGFSAIQLQSIAVHPTDRNFMIGGTQDNGTALMMPDGTWTRADFGDGGYTLIDQNATDTTNVTMYHTYFNQRNSLIGFGRVTNVADAHDDGWATFGAGLAVDPDNPDEVFAPVANGIGISDTVNFYAPMALGPGNPNTLYFGTDRLYRSTNKGDTMTVVSQGPFVSGVPVSAIGISPQNDNVRIVGLNNGRVFATTTGAIPMTDVTGVLPAKYVSRVAIDPNDPNTAYVTLAGFGGATPAHIWKTTNLAGVIAGTAVWSAADTGIGDVPVNAFVVDPYNSNNLFAGTDIGVYRSTDRGATWNLFGTGLPRVAVFDMAIEKNFGILRIATHGRGIYEIPFSGPPSLLVTTAADEDDGTSNPTFGTGTSLREALTYANNHAGPDTITFAAALAAQPILFNMGQLTINDPLTIQGLGAAQTTVNGQNNSRLFDITNTAGNVTFDGLTLTGGKTTGVGDWGGAIRSFSLGQLIIQNSTISGNSTTGGQTRGGGIFASSSVTVTNSTISGNTAGTYGGGGLSTFRSVTATNSTISGNSTVGSGAHGGGINANESVTVINSTISGNSTTGAGAIGGGIYAAGGMTIANSTITGNSVAGTNADGGGVFGGDPYYPSSPVVTIRNSILAGNQDGNGSHPDLRAGGGLTVSFSLIGDKTGTTLAEANPGPGANGNKIGNASGLGVLLPKLGSLQNNGGSTKTHALLASSPTLNAGDATFVAPPSTDQRGASFVRVAGGRIDMGAFEDQGTFVVTSTADTGDVSLGNGLCDVGGGVCTLRAALQEANASPGFQTIQFNIPGSGVKTISPTSALPTITDRVIIDATTQPGFVSAPRIQLTGNLAGAAVNGLSITVGGSMVKGLTINQFAAAGIRLSGVGGNTIVGNFIGTNTTGNAALANGTSGVLVVNSPNNTIGGTTTAARNLISGNNQYGVYVSGTNATGNLIQGNRIGTNLAGTAALGNGLSGVYLNQASNNTIGGSTTSARNLISGNGQFGVLINGTSAASNLVQRNFIGTNAAGTTALGNGRDGVRIVSGTLNKIGGTSLGNTIAFNGLSGVRVLNNTATRNLIQGNSLFDNVGLGIDLNGDGLTPNDANDPDAGPNQLQNFPVITAAVLSGTQLNLTYAVPSATANSAYPLTIEFFLADSSGQEGKTSLGRNTYASSSATLSKLVTIPKGSAVIGSQIVATATDANGNTSEFSASTTVASTTVASTLQAAGGEKFINTSAASPPPSLTMLQLQPIVAAAITRLSAVGLTKTQQLALSSVTFAISDLPGALLGMATSRTITLDANAAGYGWFVDQPSLNDQEFVTGSRFSTLDSRQHADLLTAVMQELGHLLGRSDLESASESYRAMKGM